MRIAHVPNILILKWLRSFRVKIANFSRLHCLAIPKRDLSTKKTKPNIEKWPESLGIQKGKPKGKGNSPFSSSLWPLNQRSEGAFFTALASIWSDIFKNSNEKKTCLLLWLLCIFKFQTLTCRNFLIFYFTSRLTLYECIVHVCIQRWF